MTVLMPESYSFSLSLFLSHMCEIDFDNFDKHDKKLKDWRLPKEVDWSEVRMRFTDEKPDLMNYFNVPRFDVPELMRSAEDGKKFRDVWYNVSTIELVGRLWSWITSFCLIRFGNFHCTGSWNGILFGIQCEYGRHWHLDKEQIGATQQSVNI